ncbi:MAG: 2-oxo acid dehydrogenase subunit E2 [Ignavibacteriales bacterium]|nr:2-oxo acid dehydrogenase subunit E2 [Ignavibacteriales bacterium]
MIVDFRLPHLGDGIHSADVIKILVKEGDNINTDQVVVEIETDKATVEIPSDISGIVKKVYVKDGQKAEVGEPLVAIEVSSLQSAVGSEKEEVRKEKESEIRNKKSEGELVVEPVVNNQSLITSNRSLITENEQSSIPSPIDLVHHMPKIITVPKNISKVVVPAAPSVRRFTREIGVDISLVRGSGSSGRISIEDVKAYAKTLNEQIQTWLPGQQGGFTLGGVGAVKESLPDFSKWGEIEHQSMSNIRRKTAEHLSYSWSTVPHVTQFDKADITELENLRKQFGKKVIEAGGKLTVTAILLKVIASAFKVFPQFNTSVDVDKSEIIFKKFINVGVAVDTDRGLLVPVIRDVDKKNIIQLSIELQEVSKKARDKKLSLEEMQGGCFTISNLGGIGGTYFTPIVNSPEVAILGVSKSSYEPVYINEKFEPRLIMPLSLSYDHRIIDGADGIRFLKWVVNALENPFLLSLEG